MRANAKAQERRLRMQLVRRAIETQALLLATLLDRYATAEKMNWAALARSLGCAVDALNQVALCRPPRPERFVEDVEAIAAEHVDPARLLTLLRRIAAREAITADRAAETAPPYTVDRIHENGRAAGPWAAGAQTSAPEESEAPSDTPSGDA